MLAQYHLAFINSAQAIFNIPQYRLGPPLVIKPVVKIPRTPQTFREYPKHSPHSVFANILITFSGGQSEGAGSHYTLLLA
mmetsp:Transcript_16643/g.20017  ORF Transcript_16643/g.20017 Transcript_16643/m.20017 type:complete len:80 (+) Transcript_16643:784-1023(+)